MNDDIPLIVICNLNCLDIMFVTFVVDFLCEIAS